MKAGRFRPLDPEFDLLHNFLKPGDWALDIGANVGYYSLRLSELVGPEGRVIAFEPLSRTVEVLSYCTRYAPHDNITIVQSAVSDKPGILRFTIDTRSDGLPDYFTARASASEGKMAIYATSIDTLALPHRVALAKIDTEGAERFVLRGMEELIKRDHPVLIVEGDETLEPYLASFGYRMVPRKPPSANLLFLPTASYNSDSLNLAGMAGQNAQEANRAPANSTSRRG